MSQTVAVYLNHENLPDLREIRCINCGRLFMQVNRNVLAITNTAGLPLLQVPLGMGYVHQKCRGCSMLYAVVFQ